MTKPTNKTSSCPWCAAQPIYQAYHDQEWGVPVFDDNKLFEFLILEGAQAGLSWLTILRRREAYRKAYEGFVPKQVAQFNEEKVCELLQNEGIIRNKLKIQACIGNAQGFLKIQAEFGSFANYLWGFVEHQPVVNQWKVMSEVPTTSAVAIALSKDLKKRGFKFVGPTIMYAYMQAMGLVNDHLLTCAKHDEIAFKC